jgi:hypothetical protein
MGENASLPSWVRKRAMGWGFNSAVECLPSMHKGLGSVSSTTKLKKERKES